MNTDPALGRRLTALAQETRQFLLPHWLASPVRPKNEDAIVSASMCTLSSVFFGRVLFLQNRPSSLQTGSCLDRKGFFHDGEWHTHSWRLVENWIVDFTSDQFGGAPSIIVTPVNDPRYVANTLSRRDMQALENNAARLINPWWQEWLGKKTDPSLIGARMPLGNLSRAEL